VRHSPVVLALLLSACVGQSNSAGTQASVRDQTQTLAAREARIPENPLKEAYFGETHTHTSYSLDAFIGSTRLTPDDAYRFARGGTVLVNNLPRKLDRPLDFAAVTDHAEFLGEMYSAQVPGAPGYDDPLLAELRGLTDPTKQLAWFVKYVQSNVRSGKPDHPSFYAGPETTASAWRLMAKAASDHYVPGRFTTFAGFEWSSAPGGANLHRNVLFRDLNLPDLPFSSIDSPDEKNLWLWIDDQQRQMGSRAFAIPHNSNASKTLMFAATDRAGKPIDADYARLRARIEPLIEMMQVKGNSEVTQSLWPADEFAGFENAPSMANFGGRVAAKPNYVRWGIAKGLAYEKSLGVNPFSYGFAGGTDTHNGTPGDTSERRFEGGHGQAEGAIKNRREDAVPGWLAVRESNPGSLTGVWATRNTRGAIWDAMYARETFATSGTRIKVRFFGGIGLSATPRDATALVKQGYQDGVPMGQVLARSANSPAFTFWALKDPDGANLDRIQIVKAWVDADGEPQERIFNVAWSGKRQLRSDGSLAEVGNTVDLKTARYRNSIGSAMLMGRWTDPGFDPDDHALYYVRVLEIPTPRWTTFDAVRNRLPLLKDVPATIQERAWTSPIWYNPKA
jgi:Protein of unknown function (DUF3604)